MEEGNATWGFVAGGHSPSKRGGALPPPLPILPPLDTLAQVVYGVTDGAKLLSYERRSICCKAPVADAFDFPTLNKAANGNSAREYAVVAAKIRCEKCGAASSRHEVVDSLGRVIWPLDHLPLPPKKRKKRRLPPVEWGLDPDLTYHPLHLDRQTLQLLKKG